MKQDRTMQLRDLSNWWSSALGETMLACEEARLAHHFQHIFGFHAILLGVSHQLSLMENSRISAKFFLNPYRFDVGLAFNIKGLWESLPILDHSVDLVVAPHTLEWSADPVETLKEIYRVLIPEGRLLIFGINPYSYWRFQSFFSKKDKAIPWPTCLHSLRWVKSQCQRLGFSIVHQEPVFVMRSGRSLKWKVLRSLGLSRCAGLYYLEVQKKVHGMHAIKAEAMAVKKVKQGAVISASAELLKKEGKA